LTQGRWADLEGLADEWATRHPAAAEPDVLRARGHLARREFDQALRRLDAVVARAPQDVWAKLIRARVLLQQDHDHAAAEAALREVLALDPGNQEAKNNLAVLRRRVRDSRDADFQAMGDLAGLYRAACAGPSDIHEHLPLLYALVQRCAHVTEFGTREGQSTTAFLYAQPQKLVCYDRIKYPRVDALASLAGATRFEFRQADVLTVEIEETDLLFIDTWHVYDQLKKELDRHAGKARKFIVLHDTTTFGEKGETEGHRGLWPAVEELLAQGAFRLKARFENNNGLTVLERVGAAGLS
jgi:hypothetical protein